jgi:large subunit ribosomal protein L28
MTRSRAEQIRFSIRKIGESRGNLQFARISLDAGRFRCLPPRPQPDFHHTMARVCSIRGTRPRMGRRIHRSGLAKKKGGIGRHVTKTVKRKVLPNIQTKRIWVPELNRHVRVKLSARALKTINKNGAYKTLKAAGLI